MKGASVQLLKGVKNIKPARLHGKLIMIIGFIMSDNNYLDHEWRVIISVGAGAHEIAMGLHGFGNTCKITYLEPPICWWYVKQHKGSSSSWHINYSEQLSSVTFSLLLSVSFPHQPPHLTNASFSLCNGYLGCDYFEKLLNGQCFANSPCINWWSSKQTRATLKKLHRHRNVITATLTYIDFSQMCIGIHFFHHPFYYVSHVFDDSFWQYVVLLV